MSDSPINKITYNIFCYTILVVMSTLLILFIGGDTFKPILADLGLYNPEQGIYADCSRPENRNNKFCGTPRADSYNALKAAKEGGGFSLTDR